MQPGHADALHAAIQSGFAHVLDLVRDPREALARLDGASDASGGWSEALWQVLVETGAPRWSVPVEQGGIGASRPLLMSLYAALAGGSLTAVFILTQHDAAVRRLAAARDSDFAKAWLERIADGEVLASVGISHLTTSSRAGSRALHARPTARGGYLLDGAMPWVTAAERADVIVAGATVGDGRQILVACPTDRPGMSVEPAFRLAALTAACTSEVRCESYAVGPEEVLAGPAEDINRIPGLAGTGGLETSALALGQALAPIEELQSLSELDASLEPTRSVLAASWGEIWDLLHEAAVGRPDAVAPGEIRARANTLVLAATQAYLAARKGTGFLASEKAQRWARQALFFLVWSCPTPVARATMADLTGLCEFGS
jgi:alkylation response protein AidB-like acyl-CoA dehydrogenase